MALLWKNGGVGGIHQRRDVEAPVPEAELRDRVGALSEPAVGGTASLVRPAGGSRRASTPKRMFTR